MRSKAQSNAVARTRKVLAAHGMDVKGSVAREIVAAAFGYHSTNEMDADRTPMQAAERVGEMETDAGTMVLLRDPMANAVYGIESSFLEAVVAEDRSEMVGVTPYGHVVDLLPAIDEEPGHPAAPAFPYILATRQVDGETVYWSNEDGWVDRESATMFMAGEHLSLPNLGIDTRIDVLPADDGWRKADQEDLSLRCAEEIAIHPFAIASGISVAEMRTLGRGRDVAHLLVVKCHDDQTYAAWKREVREDVLRAGCSWYEAGQVRGVLTPRSIAAMAADAGCWRRAMTDLLRPVAGERIIAEFSPEIWVRDWAIPADPEGETDMDITFEVLLMGKAAALELDDNSHDADDLRSGVRVPEWIRDWSGPFTVHASSAIENSFLGWDDEPWPVDAPPAPKE